MTEKSSLTVKTMVLGELDTNCYIIRNNASDVCVVVDPAENPERILRAVEKDGAVIGAVLLTHGHFDHIGAAEELRRQTGCKIYAGAQEVSLLADAAVNLSVMFGAPVTLQPDVLLKDGEKLQPGGIPMEVIATPGHTEGSVCFYLYEESILLAGDTLFAGSAGRTDFPTGSGQKLLHSLRERLAALPDRTAVLSGHGSMTTIGHEKSVNPYM